MKNSQETKQKSSTKHGTIIELGDHILVCGSSLDTKLIEKVLHGRTINMINVDPPYGVDVVASKKDLVSGSKHKDIANDGIASDAEYISFTKAWLEPVLPYMTKKNCMYIFNSDKMIFALREAMMQLKLKVSQLLIWVKDKAVIGRLNYLPQHELILYGWKGTHDFKRSKSKSVLFYPRPQKSSLHPTTKPIPLVRHLILNNSKIGDTVYDPFLGSGTTLLACEQTKRKCIGFELSPEYCDIIIRRYMKMKAYEK